jgi:hypothetical protein
MKAVEDGDRLSRRPPVRRHSRSTGLQAQGNEHMFGWLYFLRMLMLICCKKTLFHGWLILADKLKRTEP